jgi:hypothetical protein
MGFTQYWYREKIIDQAIYNKIVTDFKKIREELLHRGVLLAGLNGDGVPVITDSQINFNGSAKLQGSGEPFKFDREIQFDNNRPRKLEQTILQFTKTEGFQYNLAVMVFLVIAKYHLDRRISVQSDGSQADWDEAREICQTMLGYGKDFRVDKK